jgi:hypothetical protein
MEPSTTEILLDAHQRAADAHGITRRRFSAEWYAEHMTRTLSDSGYRLTKVDRP